MEKYFFKSVGILHCYLELSCILYFQDPRLAGGYENVPTVDTHMTQLGWEKEWLLFLREFVAPMANKVYMGYTSEVGLLIVRILI